MASLTFHARSQCKSRGVSPREVLRAVEQVESQIKAASDQYEAKVVVKTLHGHVFLPDGSNGDTVIACVDTRTLRVKTVMLQRSTQVERKSKYELYL